MTKVKKAYKKPRLKVTSALDLAKERDLAIAQAKDMKRQLREAQAALARAQSVLTRAKEALPATNPLHGECGLVLEALWKVGYSAIE